MQAALIDPERVRGLLAEPQGAAGSWRWGLAMAGSVREAFADGDAPVRAAACGPAEAPWACGVWAGRRLRLRGEATAIGYWCGLRTAPDAPRPFLLAQTPAMYRLLGQDDARGWGLSAIVEGNRRAERLLRRGLPDLPPYHRLDGYTVRTWSQAALRAHRPRLHLRPARADDAAALRCVAEGAGLDLLPPLPQPGPELLIACADDGRVLACGRAFRPRRMPMVTDMPAALQRWRVPINLWRRWRRLPSIPRCPHVADLRFAKDWWWLPGRVDAAWAVLAGLAGRAPAAWWSAGWSDAHPDAALLKRLPPGEDVRSTLYAVGADPGAIRLHIEAHHL